MQKSTFQFVEHYLEFIGGFRDYSGKKLGLFETISPPISLARYDVQIINSMCCQTAEMNRPLTDKQAALAVKLIEKYKRQLLSLNTPVILPDKLDCFELGIRTVDRTKSVSLNNGSIIVKFPYDTQLIQSMRKLMNDSQGQVRFDAENKIWKLSLTEYLVNWVITILAKNEFEICNELQEIYNDILQCEKQNYQIKLNQIDNKFEISNASASLNDYIENNLGGFDLTNKLSLVDNASVLGYEVDRDLLKEVRLQYQDTAEFIESRQITMPMSSTAIDKIILYAKLTNRLPIYFYDTTVPKAHTGEIIYINKNCPENLEAKLLVTRTLMMIGVKKQSWLSTAEKIIILE